MQERGGDVWRDSRARGGRDVHKGGCINKTDELYTRCPAAMLMCTIRAKKLARGRLERLNRQQLFQRGSPGWASSAGGAGRPSGCAVDALDALDACLSGCCAGVRG